MKNTVTEPLQLFQQFSKRVSYGVTINRLDGSYIQVNPSFCELSGYSEAELLTMSFRDVTHPEDVAPNVELDEKLKNGEIPYFQMSKRYITKGGQLKHVLLQVSLIRDADQEPQYYYAQVIDVTDLGHLLDERTIDSEYMDLLLDIPVEQRHGNISYEILQLYRQLNLRKTTHLGNVAHELKNPLHGIKGYANLIQRFHEKGEPVKAKQCLDLLNKNCNLLEHIINELTDLTYIETGNLKPRKSRFDANALVYSVVQSMEPMAESHELPLRYRSNCEQGFEVESDRERLWEITANLISNAIKYTEKGHVSVELQAQPEELRLIVTDTGIGIKSEDHGAIFNEFQKVHQSLSKSVDSTGLGLPITRRLVQMLGGGISVRSEPGKGSEFTVTLPLSSAE